MMTRPLTAAILAIALCACGGASGTRRERADAKTATETLERLAASPPAPELLEGLLPSFCLELPSCAGRCGETLKVMQMISWKRLDGGKLESLAKGAREDGCPEIGDAIAAGPPEGARGRALGAARTRVVSFVQRACAWVEPADRARLSVGSPNARARLGDRVVRDRHEMSARGDLSRRGTLEPRAPPAYPVASFTVRPG
jgi:hypothetical protein